jgi:hypothetical protein
VKVEAWLFGGGVPLFAGIGLVYGVITDWSEPVGPAALFLTAGLVGLIGGYLAVLSRRIDPRPEDDPHAEIAEGAGELGEFAPYSWWPLAAAAGAATVFMGAAVGWWLLYIGVGLGAVGLVGWVFEFYRGEHAH